MSINLGEGNAQASLGHVFDRNPNSTMPLAAAREMTWYNVALKGNDQLRQRVAWGLSQIFVANLDGVGHKQETELYVHDVSLPAFGVAVVAGVMWWW